MASDGNSPSLILTISDFSKETGPTTIIEKDDSEVISHEVGDIVHYIINDGKWCSATWIVDDLQCIIEGDITTEEMIKILDSIYEVS